MAITQKCKFVTTTVYYRTCGEHMDENIFALKNTRIVCIFWILLVLLWSYQASRESLIQRASEFLLKALAHLGEVEASRHSRNGCVKAPGFGLALFIWAFGAVISVGLHFLRQKVRGLGWMTSVICPDSVISFVGNSQKYKMTAGKTMNFHMVWVNNNGWTLCPSKILSEQLVSFLFHLITQDFSV